MVKSRYGLSVVVSTPSQLALGTDAQRYEALFRISEALSACREPEELSRVLADELRELISFDFLDVLIFKENSSEVEWRVTQGMYGWFGDLLAIDHRASTVGHAGNLQPGS